MAQPAGQCSLAEASRSRGELSPPAASTTRRALNRSVCAVARAPRRHRRAPRIPGARAPRSGRHRGAPGAQRRLDAGRPAVHLAAPRAHAAEALGAARKVPDPDMLAVGMEPPPPQLRRHRRVVRPRAAAAPQRRRRAIRGERVRLAADRQQLFGGGEVGREARHSRRASRRSDAATPGTSSSSCALRPLEHRRIEQRGSADSRCRAAGRASFSRPSTTACSTLRPVALLARAAGSATSVSPSCCVVARMERTRARGTAPKPRSRPAAGRRGHLPSRRRPRRHPRPCRQAPRSSAAPRRRGSDAGRRKGPPVAAGRDREDVHRPPFTS